LVLFDEVDDAIPNSPFDFSGRSSKRRQWLHQLLENNPNPAIWLCNDKSVFDEAQLHRFSLVMEMPMPGVNIKREMLTRELQDYALPATWLNRLARHSELIPALIAKLAGMADMISRDQETATAERLARQLELTFNNHRAANGHPPLGPVAADERFNTA
jgi:hypothetical protein